MSLKNQHGAPLTVWYLSPHDKIPDDFWGYERGLMLVDALSAAGCTVVFFASNFAHMTKKMRGSPWQELPYGETGKIVLVPVRPYTRHASLTRFLSLIDFAIGVWRKRPGSDLPKPDLILSSMPTPFLDLASVLLARRHGAKFIQDFRDLWPELFVYAFPPRLRWLAEIGIQPLKWLRAYSIKRCDALFAVTVEYLDFAKRIAPTVARRPHDIVYVGMDAREPEMAKTSAPVRDAVAAKQAGEVWFFYGGTLGNNYDIQVMLDAFSSLSTRHPGKRFRLNVAGDGPLASAARDAAQRHPDTIRYFGPVNIDDLWVLLKASDVGILPYAPFSTVSVPGKTFEYMCAGLAVINSLKGEVDDILSGAGISRPYEAGSAESFEAAAAWFLDNPEQTREMRSLSSKAAGRYSRAEQYGKLPRLIQAVLRAS